MTEGQEFKLAKRLAFYVAEKGESAISELKPALERVLAGKSDSEKKRFLKLFQQQLRREIAKDTLIVESAEEVSADILDQLKTSFSKNRQRPLQVETKINPELISGLKVRLGDTVYDASIAGKLSALASSVH